MFSSSAVLQYSTIICIKIYSLTAVKKLQDCVISKDSHILLGSKMYCLVSRVGFIPSDAILAFVLRQKADSRLVVR